MPLDGSVVAAIRNELEPIVIDSRIDKIYQPEPDELIITIRYQRSNIRLLLTAHNQYPRVQMTNTLRQNPAQPPVFCMLLRKHLGGGRVVRLEQPDFERMLIFHVQGTDELNQPTHKKLIVEMMGKHSNIILVDASNNQIVDAIKRIPLHISRKRQVLPGLFYEFPPSEKCSPLEVSSTHDFYAIMESHENQGLKNGLISTFNGLSPPMAVEIIHRASLDPDQRWSELTKAEKNLFCDAYLQIHEMFTHSIFSPVIYRQAETGKYMDFSVIPMTHLPNVECISFESVSKLLESFYDYKDHSDRLHQRSQDLRKTLSIKKNRMSHKLQNLQHDEEKALRASQDKLKADLIMANIHTIKPGQTCVTVMNYLDPDQSLLEITLDSMKTPSQYAQVLYRRYQKSKVALVEIEKQRRKTEMELQYLDQIIHTLEQAESLQDLEILRNELVDAGYLKKKLGRKKPSQMKLASKPLSYLTSQGRLIRVGKNNIQNEEVTFKLGKKMDLWFHVKDLPGSHVVLALENQQPTNEEIKQAALLAAYYSKGRLSNKVPVDYTWCKYVKKQRGARPGMVTYAHHQTIFVTPSEKNMLDIHNLLCEKNSP